MQVKNHAIQTTRIGSLYATNTIICKHVQLAVYPNSPIHCVVYIRMYVGEPNESGQRQEVMALCCLLVLQHQIYNTYDTKLTKQVWDLHKKVSQPVTV